MSDEDPPIKKINIKEFREQGYLQELNRQFLHPLGLAMEVEINEETGEETIKAVWDYRKDPEGMIFADGVINPAHARKIGREYMAKSDKRRELLGHVIQPVPRPKPTDATEVHDG